MTTDSLSDIVEITTTLAPVGADRIDFGRGMFLTKDASRRSRVASYNSVAEVGNDYGTTTEPYKAATAWFAQDPAPRDLLIGMWVTSALNTQVLGGTPDAAADLDQIGSSGILTIDGVSTGAIDFSSITTYTAAASAVQAALRAVSGDTRFSGATCTYQNSRFEVEFAQTADFNGSVFTGSAADALGLDSGSGATYLQGFAADGNISDALTAVENEDSSFYYVMVETSIEDTTDAAAASRWVNARKLRFGLGSDDTDVLTTNEQASQVALLAATAPARTFVVWSRTADYKAVAATAKLSAVNFARTASVITLFGKTLTGTAVDTLTQAQKTELERKNVNYYINRLNRPWVGPGDGLDGRWIDTGVWIDWFENAVQTAALNALGAGTQVPQTIEGQGIIREAIEGVCREGVRNGGIGNGMLAPAVTAQVRRVTGDQDFDGVLSNGYLIYSAPVYSQSQSDRDARRAQPFNIWLKGSGHIQSVSVSAVFEN